MRPAYPIDPDDTTICVWMSSPAESRRLPAKDYVYHQFHSRSEGWLYQYHRTTDVEVALAFCGITVEEH